jgi:hypothetical protein
MRWKRFLLEYSHSLINQKEQNTMPKFSKLLITLALLPLGLGMGNSHASQVLSQWYFGKWDCSIDGRPSKMQWRVVDDSQTSCNGDICSTSSGVKVVGRFSDNGTAWVPLTKRYLNGNNFGIRYLGKEQDNWFLKYQSSNKTATGYTTWRGNRYPLQCQWTGK